MVVNIASRIPLSDAKLQVLVRTSYNDESIYEFENHISGVSDRGHDQGNPQILQSVHTSFSKDRIIE